MPRQPAESRRSTDVGIVRGAEQLTIPFAATPEGAPPAPVPGFTTGPQLFGTSTAYPLDWGSPRSGSDLIPLLEMAKNPAVATAINLRVAMAFEDPWVIEPQNDYKRYPQLEELDWRVRDEAERQFQIQEHRDQGFEQFLRAHLKTSMEQGLCVAEAGFDEPSDGRWTVGSFHVTPGAQWNVCYDETGQLDQLLYLRTGKYVTTDRLFRYIARPYPNNRYFNPYGESLIGPVAKDVQIYNILRNCLTTSAQMVAVKTILMWYQKNQGAASIDDLSNALLTAVSGSVVTFPLKPSMALDKETGGHRPVEIDSLQRADPAGFTALQEAITLFYTQIMRGMGVADDLGYTDTKTGSRAKSQVEESIVGLLAQQDREYVELIANIALMQMWRYNFTDGVSIPVGYKWPRFRFNRTDLEERLRDMELMERAKAQGWISDDYAVERLELPPLPRGAVILNAIPSQEGPDASRPERGLPTDRRSIPARRPEPAVDNAADNA